MRSIAFLLPALVAAGPIAPVVGNDGWADAPDPKDIQIVSASFSGNGCPQGTVSTSISPDKTVRLPCLPGFDLPDTDNPVQVITFGFDAFQTYIGPGFNPTERSKNCQLHLNLKVGGSSRPVSPLERRRPKNAMLTCLASHVVPQRLPVCRAREHVPRLRAARGGRDGHLLQHVLLQPGRVGHDDDADVHHGRWHLGAGPGVHQD
ncbi:hypothetical protein VTG60DRAFT_3541 [Thermothelomyces hinnuleus]